jgi:hypothetical protein
MRKPAVAGALAIALALALVPPAVAKGGLLFPRSSARIGDTLVLTSRWVSHRDGVVVYFMPLADSPKWWPTYQALAPAYGTPPRVRSAHRLGRLEHWSSPGVRLEFRVPAVPAGRYVLGFWCIPCGTHWTSALPNYQPSPYGILRVRAR